jgi:hypothetical protein
MPWHGASKFRESKFKLQFSSIYVIIILLYVNLSAAFFQFSRWFFVRETPSCEARFIGMESVLIYCRLKFAEIATAEAGRGRGQLLILTAGRLI